MRRRYLQIDGKLVEVSTRYQQPAKHHHIVPDIEPFVSPIDGKPVTSRSHLRAHNKQHGVTNLADFSPEYREKRKQERLARMAGATTEQNRERERQVAAAYDSLTRR